MMKKLFYIGMCILLFMVSFVSAVSVDTTGTVHRYRTYISNYDEDKYHWYISSADFINRICYVDNDDDYYIFKFYAGYRTWDEGKLDNCYYVSDAKTIKVMTNQYLYDVSPSDVWLGQIEYSSGYFDYSSRQEEGYDVGYDHIGFPLRYDSSYIKYDYKVSDMPSPDSNYYLQDVVKYKGDNYEEWSIDDFSRDLYLIGLDRVEYMGSANYVPVNWNIYVSYKDPDVLWDNTVKQFHVKSDIIEQEGNIMVICNNYYPNQFYWTSLGVTYAGSHNIEDGNHIEYCIYFNYSKYNFTKLSDDDFDNEKDSDVVNESDVVTTIGTESDDNIEGFRFDDNVNEGLHSAVLSEGSARGGVNNLLIDIVYKVLSYIVILFSLLNILIVFWFFIRFIPVGIFKRLVNIFRMFAYYKKARR